jgi:hypothetical protein
VKVPFVDQVPFVVVNICPESKLPVMTGKTEFVTLDDGTTTVAAVFAVVL